LGKRQRNRASDSAASPRDDGYFPQCITPYSSMRRPRARNS
jgi:hypothetical protein